LITNAVAKLETKGLFDQAMGFACEGCRERIKLNQWPDSKKKSLQIHIETSILKNTEKSSTRFNYKLLKK